MTPLVWPLLLRMIWICVTLLIATNAAATSKDTTTQSATIPIPSRGLLLERTGTLMAHKGYLTTRFVLTLKHNFAPFFHEAGSENGTTCNITTLSQIHDNYRRQMSVLQEMVTDVLNLDRTLVEDNICKIFNLTDSTRCHTPPQRVKRFVLGAAALTTAGVALDLGLANEEQIQIIEDMLQDQRRDIEEFKESVRVTYAKGYSAGLLVMNATRNWMSMVHHVVRGQNERIDRLTCEQQYNRMTMYAQDAIRQTQQAVEMFARGDLTANLTPFMVSKFFIPHLVKFKKGRRTRKFFVSHPEMLYKVGTVTLIGADFENLQLDYVLMYPDLDSASVAPYYAIRQVGMIAHHTYDNQTTCVSLDVPNNAVYYDQRWQVLHYPERCRTHGRVILCNTLHFQLKDIHHCLTHANVGGQNCPLLTCDATQDNYISTAAGLLLRTTEDKVTLTHQFGSNQGNRTSPRIKSSIVSPLKVPPSGSVFIEWGDNVTTVAFGTTAIHAPTKILVNSVFDDLLPMVEPLLSLRDTLQIPTLGLDYLATALERYDSAIAQFDANRIAVLEMLNRSQTPSTGPLKDTFDTISNIPRYFNVILIILGCLIVFWIAKQIKDFIAPNCSCLPSCVCNRQPNRTGSRQSGRQNPDTLARCGSQISLVVHNDRDQIPLTTLSPAGHVRYVPLHPHPEEGEYSMITET